MTALLVIVGYWLAEMNKPSPVLLNLLPPRSVSASMLEMSKAHLKFLNEHRDLFRHNCRYDQAYHEAITLHLLWDSANDAACPYYSLEVRLRDLKYILDILGEEEFIRYGPPHAIPPSSRWESP